MSDTEKTGVTHDISTNEAKRVPKRILSGLMNSLSAGVVPRQGAPYIAIGRTDEITALLSDLDRTAEGEAAMKFLIGRYGSGKSFLIQLMRGYALERGFVTADCNLSIERKLAGSSGAGLATYRELIRNLATKSSPDGGALTQILSTWLTDIKSELVTSGFEVGTDEFNRRVKSKIFSVMHKIENDVGGFETSYVISTYFAACEEDDENTKSACIKYLRGEYASKRDARAFLPNVSSVVTDANWYDRIRLLASLFSEIGYKGLVVFIDECVNLYKIPNRISRENNYERILTMYNNTLEGGAPHLMIIMAGTPQFLEDRRRGLFSYEALHSRLSDGKFGGGDYINMMGPVIRLKRLSKSELLALVLRVTSLHSQYYGWTPRISEDDPEKFVTACLSMAGADIMVTPREIIRDYIHVLNILYQNPTAVFSEIVKSDVTLAPSGEGDDDLVISDDEDEDMETKSRREPEQRRGSSSFDPNDIII
ncbi:MAG: ATP-binding protein [Firmicutes bacterium]|nr:ATP-binding protein [Bacillota bacterium]